jgi:hypothetical protein
MKLFMTISGMAAVLLLVVSCASTPPQKPATETAQPESAPPEKPALAAPEAERAQARALKGTIDGYGLAVYDEEGYRAASADLQAGEDSYGMDNAAAKTSLDSAIKGFNAVISKGAPLKVAELQGSAEASKKAADDLLAAVAVKAQYAPASDAYQRALQEKEAGELENAGKDFSLAQGLFDEAAASAKQKKDEAVRAIDAAQQDLSSSEQKAADAEKSLADEGIAAQAGGQ